MTGDLVVPTVSYPYVVVAAVVCFLGVQASLLLVESTLHIQLASRKTFPLAAVIFGLQCMFSLHFIAMRGLGFVELEWGNDLIWTAASLIISVLFGTTGIALALKLREAMEESIKTEFPTYQESASSQTMWFHARCALWRV